MNSKKDYELCLSVILFLFIFVGGGGFKRSRSPLWSLWPSPGVTRGAEVPPGNTSDIVSFVIVMDKYFIDSFKLKKHHFDICCIHYFKDYLMFWVFLNPSSMKKKNKKTLCPKALTADSLTLKHCIKSHFLLSVCF